MVSTPLRQFLESLCCDSPWDYAVFWKFEQHQNELLLMWEDGINGASRFVNSMEGVTESFFLNDWNERSDPFCAANVHSGNLSNGALEVAIAEMSRSYYTIGKGLVGEVAFTENPRWILIDNFIAGEINSDIMSKYPDEILHQFAAGIKTILLVPLVPHGVLQLGSLDVVKEGDEMVINIRDKFFFHHQHEASTLDMDNLHLPTIMKFDEDLELPIPVQGQQTSNIRQIISMVQDLNQISGDLMTITDRGSEIGSNLQGLSDFTEPFCPQMWEFSESEILLDSYGFSCSGIELECLPNFSGYSVKNWKDPDFVSQTCSDDWMHVLEDNTQAIHPSERQVLNFPVDCELHKALGHSPLNQPILDLLDQNANVNSVGGENNTSSNMQSGGNSRGHCSQRTKAEFLLEAPVAVTSNRLDDTSSNKCKSTALKSSSSELVSDKFGEDDLSDESQILQSCVTTAISGDKSAIKTSQPMKPQRNGHGVVPPTRVTKVANGSKRRARSGNCQKPRPRDRQLIQDRIKELRELVPNGAKCSIDGLLDRAIKHMHFLASVTNRADKLRHHVEKKVPIRKDLPKTERNDHNGTSWALELENELQTCPIFVKDLEHPGHMLIEMLCNDNNRFLEIADVIQRLDLTILNGSMEKRSDDSAWARFVVETSGTFHRLDIFWPLMQLLQHNRSQISCNV